MTINSQNTYNVNFSNSDALKDVNNSQKETQALEKTNPPQENKRLSEDAVAVYFSYQNNQRIEENVEMYTQGESNSTESNELSYQDIHSIQQQANRGRVLNEAATKPKEETQPLTNNENINAFLKNEQNNSSTEGVNVYV